MKAYLDTPIGTLEFHFNKEFALTKISKKYNTSPLKVKNYPEKIINLIKIFNDYFSGQTLYIDYPLEINNISKFDKLVLDLIREIPFGHTVSYKWVSKKLETSPRAVGQSLRRNPLPIIIPCHRIIKSDGELGGYSLGIEAKKWLIEHEKAILYKLQLHKT